MTYIAFDLHPKSLMQNCQVISYLEWSEIVKITLIEIYG